LADNTLQIAGTILDTLEGSLKIGDKVERLRNRELRLIEIFFSSPNKIFSKNHLMDRLFSFSEEVSENAIEVYVGRLRKKLEKSDVRIETIRGLGYRFVVEK